MHMHTQSFYTHTAYIATGRQANAYTHTEDIGTDRQANNQTHIQIYRIIQTYTHACVKAPVEKYKQARIV